MPIGAFVPYTVQVFASTEGGRNSPVSSFVYTSHGSKYKHLEHCLARLLDIWQRDCVYTTYASTTNKSIK